MHSAQDTHQICSLGLHMKKKKEKSLSVCGQTILRYSSFYALPPSYLGGGSHINYSSMCICGYEQDHNYLCETKWETTPGGKKETPSAPAHKKYVNAIAHMQIVIEYLLGEQKMCPYATKRFSGSRRQNAMQLHVGLCVVIKKAAR